MVIQLGRGRPGISEQCVPILGAPPLDGRFGLIWASVVGLILILCVGVSLAAFWYTTGMPFPQARFGLYYLVGITVLMVVLPLVVYRVVRLSVEGDVSPFADIQKAWNAGLAELERQGFSLSQTPLFLILGTAGETQEKALFDGARLSLNLREFPVGPSALHWYANPDGIYLVCTTVGCLSRTAAIAKMEPPPEKALAAHSPARDKPDIRGTILTAPDAPAGRVERHGNAGLVRPIPTWAIRPATPVTAAGWISGAR